MPPLVRARRGYKAIKNNSVFHGVAINLVPVIGVEPIRYRYRGILSPVRLPIPPHRQACIYYHCLGEKSSVFTKKVTRAALMEKHRSSIIFKGNAFLFFLFVNNCQKHWFFSHSFAISASKQWILNSPI